MDNYANKNLQRVSFKDQDLSNVSFEGSDLRGADFTGSNLTGADLSRVRTGIPPANKVLVFISALIISLFSGYIAMLAGRTIQGMLASGDAYIRTAGIASIVLIILFIVYSYWKGVGTAIRNLILPASFIALLVGLLAYLTGAGTGMGSVYLVLAYILVAVMFMVGTVARAAAGTLSSNILFIVVALGGGMFGKSVGGGIGTVIMALSCALISKRALAGTPGFEALRRLTTRITSRLGTSFRDSKLVNVNFSNSTIHNTDFSGADVSTVNWGDSKKVNCIIK
ncbi:hypothetical protein GZH53_14940 [Flavihumibacter sp. R14]|nr:hypothetical protein [Flavihumibacter soli]